jgi:MinD superfamily P-loop ATPase
MIISVASGKGGTGKTTVAVSLALSLRDDRPMLLDCDVEEPNAALFLKPSIEERKEVGQLVPAVDTDSCTYCGRCAEVCAYHAMAVVGEKVLIFPQLCHGCGSCALNCPARAITEELRVMGTIERGFAGRMSFAQGTLNVGEAMAVPIIRQLKTWAAPEDGVDGLVIIDASPGTSCPVVESIRGSDFVLLVTEPTPFGLHDLRLAVQVSRDELGLPVGVLINRDGTGDESVSEYCASEGIPVLMRIPLDRRIAEGYSEGSPLVETLPEYEERFRHLYRDIEDAVGSASADVDRKVAS